MSFCIAQVSQPVQFTNEQSQDYNCYIQQQLLVILSTLRQQHKQLQQKYQFQIQKLKASIINQDLTLASLRLQIKQLHQEQQRRSKQQIKHKRTQTSSQTSILSEQFICQKQKTTNDSKNQQIIRNSYDKQGLITTSNNVSSKPLKQIQKSERLRQQQIGLERFNKVYQDLFKNSNSNKKKSLIPRSEMCYIETDNKQQFISLINHRQTQKSKLQNNLVSNKGSKQIILQQSDFNDQIKQSLVFSSKRYKNKLQQAKSQPQILSNETYRQKQLSDKKVTLPKEIQKSINIITKVTKHQSQNSKVKKQQRDKQKLLMDTQQSFQKLNYSTLSFKKRKKTSMERSMESVNNPQNQQQYINSLKGVQNSGSIFDKKQNIESLIFLQKHYQNKTVNQEIYQTSKMRKSEKNNQHDNYKSYNNKIKSKIVSSNDRQQLNKDLKRQVF